MVRLQPNLEREEVAGFLTDKIFQKKNHTTTLDRWPSRPRLLGDAVRPPVAEKNLPLGEFLSDPVGVKKSVITQSAHNEKKRSEAENRRGKKGS